MRALVTAYVEFVRNVPLLLLIYLVFYGIPSAGGFAYDATESFVATLALYSGAYLVEVFRAGAAAGVFVDEPPAQQARLMIAILQVILGEWVDDGMTTSPDEVLRRIADAMTRCFAARPETQP